MEVRTAQCVKAGKNASVTAVTGTRHVYKRCVGVRKSQENMGLCNKTKKVRPNMRLRRSRTPGRTHPQHSVGVGRPDGLYHQGPPTGNTDAAH